MIRVRDLFAASLLMTTSLTNAQINGAAPTAPAAKDTTAVKPNQVTFTQNGLTYSIDEGLAKSIGKKKEEAIVVSGSNYDDHWVIKQRLVGLNDTSTLHTSEVQVRSMDRNFQEKEIRARAETFTRPDDKSRSITFMTVLGKDGESQGYMLGWSPIGSLGAQNLASLRDPNAKINEEFEVVDTLGAGELVVTLKEKGIKELVEEYEERYKRSAGTLPIQNDVVTILFETKNRVMRESSQYLGSQKNPLDTSNIGFVRTVYRGAGHVAFGNDVDLNELGIMAQAAGAFYAGDVIAGLYKKDPKVVNAYVKGTLALLRNPEDSTLTCGIVTGYTDDGLQLTCPQPDGKISRREVPHAALAKHGAIIDVLRMSDPKIAKLASTSGNDDLNTNLPAGQIVYAPDTTSWVKEVTEFIRVYGRQEPLQAMIENQACIGEPGEVEFMPFFGGKTNFQHNLIYDPNAGQVVAPKNGNAASGSGNSGASGGNNSNGRTYQQWVGHIGPAPRLQ